MSLPCGKDTTFGISSPFGLLSPSLRQVVYALLTRLPLGIFSSLNFKERTDERRRECEAFTTLL